MVSVGESAESDQGWAGMGDGEWGNHTSKSTSSSALTSSRQGKAWARMRALHAMGNGVGAPIDFGWPMGDKADRTRATEPEPPAEKSRSLRDGERHQSLRNNLGRDEEQAEHPCMRRGVGGQEPVGRRAWSIP